MPKQRDTINAAQISIFNESNTTNEVLSRGPSTKSYNEGHEMSTVFHTTVFEKDTPFLTFTPPFNLLIIYY